MECFAEEGFSQSLNSLENETIKFSVPAYDLRELQTGKEYIMPFMTYNLLEHDENSIEVSSVLYADNTGYFAMKTDKGWLIYDCGVNHSELFEAMEADTEEIFNDIKGTGSYYLEPSDEKMNEKIRTYLENRETVYYHT